MCIRDSTQALLAVILTVLPLWGLYGFFNTRAKDKTLLGTSGDMAAAAGGTKSSPMQA